MAGRVGSDRIDLHRRCASPCGTFGVVPPTAVCGTPGGPAPPPGGGGAGDMRLLTSPATAITLRDDALLALAVAVVLVVGSDVALKDDLWAGAPHLVWPVVPELSELVVLLAATLP